jgi:PilZ domain
MDQRKHLRCPVEQELECFIQDQSIDLYMYDLCLDGCCLDIQEFKVDPGERVQVALGCTARVGGRIVWADGRYAGVQFDQELHPAMVLNLALKPIAVSITELDPRDRYGRKLPPLRYQF